MLDVYFYRLQKLRRKKEIKKNYWQKQKLHLIRIIGFSIGDFK